jgi:hypothetical protein
MSDGIPAPCRRGSAQRLGASFVQGTQACAALCVLQTRDAHMRSVRHHHESAWEECDVQHTSAAPKHVAIAVIAVV